MDVNTTVAVDIMIRTSIGSANTDFNRMLSRMEADARAFATRINAEFRRAYDPAQFTRQGQRAGQAFYQGFNNASRGRGSTTGASGTTGSDPAMSRAMADINRMQQQRIRMEA